MQLTSFHLHLLFSPLSTSVSISAVTPGGTERTCFPLKIRISHIAGGGGQQSTNSPFVCFLELTVLFMYLSYLIMPLQQSNISKIDKLTSFQLSQSACH